MPKQVRMPYAAPVSTSMCVVVVVDIEGSGSAQMPAAHTWDPGQITLSAWHGMEAVKPLAGTLFSILKAANSASCAGVNRSLA